MTHLKGLLIALMMMGIMTMPVWAVGTVNQAISPIGRDPGSNPDNRVYQLAINWTADASIGTVPVTALNLGAFPAIQGMRLVSVEIKPGSPAPTNLYSITITDAAGVDLLGGTGANLSNTVATSTTISNLPAPVFGGLTFTLTGNSVNSATGTVYAYFAPLTQTTITTGAPTLTGANTLTGTNTFTGPTITTNLNNCQHVDGSQTLPAAIAAAGNPGCIFLDINYVMTASSVIPSTVILRSDGAGGITTTGFTLTINGPIVAPASQLFFGTGTVTLGSNNPIRAIWFPGSDFHAKLQNAYNALPAQPSAGQIYVDPNPAGGCWVTTTTASLNTANKYAYIIAASPASPNVPQQGFCDNFTPTITGSAVSISAISIAANLVTVTCSATCTTGWTGGGGSTATVITVRGVTIPDYNGVWSVQTVTDGTHFTYNASIGLPGASSGGTVAQSPYAIELDWTPSNGGGYNQTAGMTGYVLLNNSCTTIGGCGSYAVGILLSRTNAGIHAGAMYNDQVFGFGTGIAKINNVNCQTGWGTNWAATSLNWNNTGYFVGCANENDTWSGNSKIAQNGTGFQLAGSGAEITFVGGSFDSQTICGVQMDVGTIWHSIDLHYENNGAAPTTYVCSTAVNSILDIVGGIAYDDGNGSGTNNWFQAGYINVSSMSISSQKAYPSQWVFAAGTRGKVDVINVLPANTPNIIFGNGGTNILTTVQNPTSSFYTPVLGMGEIAAPSGFAALAQDICYGDSTAHGLKCSYNNGSFFNLPLVGTANTWSANQSFNSGTLLPSAAGGTDVGSTTLPFGNLWLGSSSTSQFKFAPSATTAARTITIPDPGNNANLTLTPCFTSQRTETAADANLLTCAIPAQAGSYRVRFVLSVSAANAATLGWTLTYTNPNGAAEAPTNMALFQIGTAAPALTFTTSSQGDWNGSADIDVNNAGTSIVVKLTFSGTSFTAKATASVERII